MIFLGLIPWFNASQAASLVDLIESGPYRESWEPAYPSGYDTHSVLLTPEKPLEIEIPSSSGLRIDSPDSLDPLAIHTSYMPSLPPFTRTLVPVTDVRTIGDGSLVILTGITTGQTFVLTTSSQHLRLNLFQFRSIPKPYYWDTIQAAALAHLTEGTLSSTLDTLADGVETRDDYSLTGLWIRMAKSVLDTSTTLQSSKDSFRNGIIAVTRIFEILFEEDTYDEPLDMDKPVAVHAESDKDSTIEYRDYQVLETGQSIEIEGPAWLFFSLRIEWQDIPTSNLIELPFDMRIDDVRTGHWPTGMCRFLADPLNTQVSAPINHSVYIPEGMHRLAFDTGTAVHLRGFERRPVFYTSQLSPSLSPNNLFEQIPVYRLMDIGWLDTQYHTGGKNPILQRIATHFIHRYRWSYIDCNSSAILQMEPDFKPITTLPGIVDPEQQEPFLGLYRLPDGIPVAMNIRIPADTRPSLGIINLLDPDRTANEPAPVILIDDEPIVHPDLTDPFNGPRQLSLSLPAGTHTLQVNTQGRQIFCDYPLENIQAEQLLYRKYYLCNPDADTSEVTFKVNGGHYGAPVRIYTHQSSPALVSIRLNGTHWTDLMTSHPVNLTDNTGVAELMIPAGTHILTVESASPTLLAIAQPAWLETIRTVSIRRDPFTETILHAIADPPTLPELLDLLQSQSSRALESILWLTLAGDHIHARDLLLETGFDEHNSAHIILMAWILAESGYDSRAVNTAWPLIQDESFPYSEIFCRRMLNAAISTGGIYRATVIASRIQDNGDGDPITDTILKGLAVCSKGLTLNLETMAFSDAPRWLPIPTANVVCETETTRLMDRWFSSEWSPVSERDPSLYWMMDPGTSMQIDIPEPALIRLTIRPPGTETDPAMPSNPAWLTLGTSTVSARIPIPMTQMDRDTLYWESLAAKPGKPLEMIIPVVEAGQLFIQCQNACLAIKPWIQVVSLSDMIRMATAGAGEETKSFMSEYNRILNLSDTEHPDLTLLYAEISELMHQAPGMYPCRSFLDILGRSLDWKLLSGWPVNNAGRSYLASHQLQHDPLVLIRSVEIPEPSESGRSHVLTDKRQVLFDPQDLPEGSLEFRAGFLPSTDFRILIEMDRRGVGSLSPDDPVLKIPWNPGDARNIKVYADFITGRFPVRLSANHFRTNKARPLQLAGNRRYFDIPSLAAAALSGPVIGPACLKLEFRNDRPGVSGQRVAVIAARSDSDERWETQIDIPLEADADYTEIPKNNPVGKSVELTVPLVETGVYNLIVRSMNSTDSHVLCRGYAIRYATVDSMPVQTCDWTSRVTDSTDLSVPEKQIPSRDNASINQFDSGTFHPGTAPVSNPGIGTWKVGVSYRYRDRNPDPDAEDSGVYSGDGPGISIGLMKRLDSAGNRHRVYLDGTLGASYSNDEPSGVIGSFIHDLDWHIADSGFRFRWHFFSALQTVDNDRLWRYKFQSDFRRSFDLMPSISLTGAIGGFITQQSLDPVSIDQLADRPHPSLYTDFDDRHESGVYLQLFCSTGLSPNWRLSVAARTISAGDDESGTFGPWWARIGLNGRIGQVIAGLSYEERQSFGTSPEPDRSRLEGNVSMVRWQGTNSLWEINFFHRYTLTENWTDTGLTISLRFNNGQLLRDADPFRILFKDRIEALCE